MAVRELLDLSRGYLEQQGILAGTMDENIELLASLSDQDIPLDMRMTMALYTISTYVGHFKYKMKLAPDDIQPVNVIMFGLAKSGAGKTSSLVGMRESLNDGYDILDSQRLRREEELAAAVGATPKELESLSCGLSTVEGLAAKIHRFSPLDELGCPSLIIDEVSNALKANTDIASNMQFAAELFDKGFVEEKTLKSEENRTPAIHNMGITALFMGSEEGILNDPMVLRQFLTEIISKYARRCWFIYPEFIAQDLFFNDMDEFFSREDTSGLSKEDTKAKLNKQSRDIALVALEQDQRIIDVPDGMKNILRAYKAYCSERAKKLTDEPTKLEMAGRDWKVIKAACALSVFNGYAELRVQDYVSVVSMAEKYGQYLEKFIRKAKRLDYEVFADYVLTNKINHVSFHDLAKMEIIKNPAQMQKLVVGANSLIGGRGRFEVAQNVGINYLDYEAVNINEMWCSMKPLFPLTTQALITSGMTPELALKTAKEIRAKHIVDGFAYECQRFEDYAQLLTNDCAFTPFRFRTKEEGGKYNERLLPEPQGGIRGKDNVASGAQFVVLDIDDDGTTIEEAQELFCDYKYHMARTSNPDNPYKFRVIIPLDIIMTTDGTMWKKFMQIVGAHFGIAVDDLPQSQIFYGFSNREVISNYDGECLEAGILIKQIVEDSTKIEKQPQSMRDEILKDVGNEFAYAIGVESGRGVHMALFKVMRHAADAGFSIDENRAIVAEIVERNRDKPRTNFLASLESQRVELYGKMEDPMEDKY